MGISRTGSNAYIICTSSTHPNPPSPGMAIYETDTNLAYVWDGSVWQPLGQAARAWTFISEVNLGSDGAISFTSIPATFTHLQLVGSLRSAGAVTFDNHIVRFNNDSSAIYDDQYLYGFNTSVQAGGQVGMTGVNPGYVAGNSLAANVFSAYRLDLMNYTNTSMFKNGIQIAGVADATAGNSIGATTWFKWRSTAVVNRVDLIAANGPGTWKANSRVTLLGMR